MPMPVLVPVLKPLGTSPEIEGVDYVGAGIESVTVEIAPKLEDGAVVEIILVITAVGWKCVS